MKEQMDMMRSLVETPRTTGVPSGEGRTVEGHGLVRDKLVLTKLTDADDIEAFLTTFERLMTVYGLPEDRWAIKLAPQLPGRALEAYAALSSTAASNYEEVKKAILRRYDISEETYRQRFRSTRRKDGKSYTELVTQLKSLATKWLTGCDSVAAVIEKLVVEQLLDILPQDLCVWLCERKPTNGDEAATFADDYCLARRRRRGDVRKKESSDKGAHRCFRCDQEGHYTSQCPKRNSDNQSTETDTKEKPQDKSKGKSNAPKCYNCHQRGHLARNCPKALYCEESVVHQGGGGREEVVLGEASGCGTEGDGVGAVSDGGGGERKKVGDGVPGVEVEVFGEEDGVQEVVRGPVGTVGERFNCGVPVNRRGTIDGRPVDDIILDTGCSRTMVRQDLLPPHYQTTGTSVQIRCVHGDVTTYPLAKVHLEIGGVGVEAIAAVSRTLPVSALVGTDIPQLGPLINTSPNPNAANHWALVVTRAQAKRNAAEEDDNCQRDQQSGVIPNTVDTSPQDDPQPFSVLDDDLFEIQTPRKKATRCEKRLTRQKFGLVRAKDQKPNEELPADLSREELQKLQDADESLNDAWESAKDPTQPFF